MDIATYRLNRPTGRFSDKHNLQCELFMNGTLHACMHCLLNIYKDHKHWLSKNPDGWGHIQLVPYSICGSTYHYPTWHLHSRGLSYLVVQMLPTLLVTITFRPTSLHISQSICSLHASPETLSPDQTGQRCNRTTDSCVNLILLV